MEEYFIEGTAKTPEINFNPNSGVMKISGRAIPDDARNFWSPVLSWFFAYSSIPASSTEFTFDMAYYNIHTAKQIMFLFYQINEMHKSGNIIKVNWLYDEEDIEMKEAGHDFASLLCFEINIQAKAEKLVSAS